MYESANTRRILTAVPEKASRTSSQSWLAMMKNDLSSHNLSVEDAMSCHWTGHSGGHWHRAELLTEVVQAE